MNNPKEDSPLISVIMPVYNGSKYLAQAIESLLKQQCDDLEIIIVNDGSTDESDNICRQYCSKNKRIRYFYRENRGVSAARNFAIDRAKGKYIAFLDSDDVWCRGFYDQRLHDMIITDKSDIYCFGFIVASDDLKRGNIVYTRNLSSSGNKFDLFGQHLCAYLYSRQMLLNSDVRFRENVKYDEDTDWYFRAFCTADTVSSINKYIFVYRNNYDSVTYNIGNKAKIFCDSIGLWMSNLEILNRDVSHKDEKAIEKCKSYVVNNYYLAIKYMAKEGYDLSYIQKEVNNNLGIDIPSLNNENLEIYDEVLQIKQGYDSDPKRYVEYEYSISQQGKLKRAFKSIMKKIRFIRRWYHKKSFASDIGKYLYQ